MDSHNSICENSKSKASSSKAKRQRQRKRGGNSKFKRIIIDGGNKCTRPFVIGIYSPATAPDRIPYHLYLLVKEAVDRSSTSLDLTRVEKKISFFCDVFYSHLPLGWKYDRDNANSLIARCDAFFAKGGPKYNLSGYTPFGNPVSNDFDDEAQLPIDIVFEIMSIVHSRKTPTPKKLMQWGDENFISFYCKLCSCFGIDYQHLEAASEDDVILMNMGSKRRIDKSLHDILNASSYPKKPNKRGVEKVSSNEDNYMFKHMRKLSSNDEAFELSMKEIRDILRIIRSWRLPPQTTFTQWNEYQISFYCKMCSCYGVDYHHLEAP